MIRRKDIEPGGYCSCSVHLIKAEGRWLSLCMQLIRMNGELGTLSIPWRYLLHKKYRMLRLAVEPVRG